MNKLYPLIGQRPKILIGSVQLIRKEGLIPWIGPVSYTHLEIRAAIKEAQAEKERPTLIIGKTVMGKGARFAYSSATSGNITNGLVGSCLLYTSRCV